MFIKLTYRGLWSMVKTNRSPESFGLEYDNEILHYKIIDEPLFFLSVIKLDIEFDVVTKESRAAVQREIFEKFVDKPKKGVLHS
jgi:hypothetical protein